MTTIILLVYLLLTNTAHSTELSSYENNLVKFSLPNGWNLGEVAGIAKTPNRHFIVFHRGEHQLLEFDQNKNFVREFGQGVFKSPHGLRIDSKGNIWTTDRDTHLVLRFSPSGKITMVLGKNELAGTG